MLRITTTTPSPDHATLRVEGRLTGASVAELERSCEDALAAHATVSLDLFDVRSIDAAGIALMRALARRPITITRCSPFVAAHLQEISR